MAKLTPYQKAALNYQKHISLTANAGSGKTFVLSKRYVEIALNENIPLSSIVAITFTEKAAGELNKKIAGEIEERIENSDDPNEKYKLENLRRRLVSANISTIHSFCRHILKEFAPEAGLDANFNTIDQVTAKELIDQTIEEVTANLINDENESEKIKYLIRLFGSRDFLKQQLNYLLQQRRHLIKLKKRIYNATEKEIAGIIDTLFEKGFKDIFADDLNITLKYIEIINKAIIESGKENELTADVTAYLEMLKNEEDFRKSFLILDKLRQALLTTSGKRTLREKGYAGKIAKEYPDEVNFINNFFADIRSINISGKTDKANLELAKTAKVLLSVFKTVHDLYSRKKKAKGYLDFEDMLLYTQKILEQDEVKNYLSDKFQYLMIDEYQDTNELQYEIFMPMLDSLRKGNLFVVGDEKQSIYMFRDAELEIFNQTKKDISESGGKSGLLSLPHSFRLAPNILLFTNELFKNLFASPDEKFNEVEHKELICARGEDAGGNIEFLLSDDESASESEMLAAKILELANSGEGKKAFGDIAILSRKRTSFAELERVLIKYDIPFTLIGGKGYYQRQIIYDIYNYLSFMLSQKNDAALVGILRSPFFTLSDRVIYQISHEKGASYFHKLKSFSVRQNEISKIISTLEDHIKIAKTSDLTHLIRTILKDSGYWGVISKRKNADQEIANLEKLLNISLKFSKQSFRTLYDFVNYLGEAIDTLSDEGQADIAATENKVKIMTLHQSKGLEFDTLFLYSCNDTTGDDSIKSGKVVVDKNFGILTKVPVDNSYFQQFQTPPVVGLYNYIAKRKQAAENKRLLYVGVTRAINNLIITATVKSGKLREGSLIELIANGLNIDFGEDHFSLSGRVTFMNIAEDDFPIYQKDLNHEIKILKSVESGQAGGDESEKLKLSEPEFLLGEIADLPKREIISATKIAVFTQCPVKYKLIYDLGYSRLFRMLKKHTFNYNFNSKEDEEGNSFADLRGRIIHAVLQDEVKTDHLREYISRQIDHLTIEEKTFDTDKEILIESITKDVFSYYKSGSFKEINSFGNYKNEYEIYTQQNDYFLYGIVDKFIIEEDKLIVIDYKTDKIEETEIETRSENYKPQLLFYLNILSKLFPDINNFEAWLLYIRVPENIKKIIISRKEVEDFENKLDSIVSNIRNEIFNPNLTHCKSCHFTLKNNKCVTF